MTSDNKEEVTKWTDTSAHPWRRFAARMTDNILNGFIFAIILVVGMSIFDFDSGIIDKFFNSISPAADAMLTLFISIFINTLFIRFTGNTIGKFIFGIKIIRENNNTLDCWVILKREFMVWFKGMAMGIPILNLFTIAYGYNSLTKESVTNWDKELKIKIMHRNNNIIQKILYFLGTSFLIIFIIIKLLPHNQ